MYIQQIIVIGSDGDFIFTVGEQYAGKQVESIFQLDNVFIVSYIDGSLTEIHSNNVIVHKAKIIHKN